MSKIEFSDEGGTSEGFISRIEHTPPKINAVEFLVRRGVAKNTTTASYMLIGVAVFFFAASIFFFIRFNRSGVSREALPVGTNESIIMDPSKEVTIPE
ncbi:MAG: hypothetical protein K0S38_342 [Candidatus Paceibacter sp.]|jgi:sorbitol-specific phosphotransferase system component IIC|nr:hypothetical protein [Candidatus Paceibacter sp.]